MGMIRKAASVSTLGKVGWNSKQEKFEKWTKARMEAEAKARAEIERKEQKRDARRQRNASIRENTNAVVDAAMKDMKH